MIASLALALKVCLVPVGPHDARLLPPVARGIEHVYGFTVDILPARALPKEAYYAPRRRWRAEKLLAFLDVDVPEKCQAVMGWTSVDISTTKDKYVDWGVLGLASIGGPSGVVSSYRMKGGQLARRAVKTVNHELGHVLGLEHDDSVAGCVMNDAKGTVKTVDRETGVLCDHERAALEKKLGVELPKRAAVDWRWVMTGR